MDLSSYTEITTGMIIPGLVSCTGVELFCESHNVDTEAKSRSTGGLVWLYQQGFNFASFSFFSHFKSLVLAVIKSFTPQVCLHIPFRTTIYLKCKRKITFNRYSKP